jgi:antitoxin (DNA-binding transcriptional repressor) of toxin-antitoxin stability system
VMIGADACRVSFGYWLGQVATGTEVVVTRRGKRIAKLTAVGPASAPAPGTVAVPPLLPPEAATGSP